MAALAAVVVPSILLGQAFEGTSGDLLTPFTETALVYGNSSNAVFVAGLRKNAPAPSTNAGPRIAGPNQGQVLFLQPNRPAGQLAPGVYETAPYTCIVVVPGAHPDDKMIVGGAAVGMNEVDPKMPIVRPELRFIPRGKK